MRATGYFLTAVKTLLIILGCFLLPSATTAIVASENAWTGFGPFGGAINGIVIDPGNPSTIYAATEIGLFKTVNSGAEWRILDSYNIGRSVGSITLDPQNPSVIYTEKFKSVDGGLSWKQMVEDMYGSLRLVVDPSNSSNMYIGTTGYGIFKSTDGGKKWKSINEGIQPFKVNERNVPTYTNILCLAVDPKNSDALYAADTGFFYKSVDGGGHWTPILKKLITSMAIDPVNTSIVYAGAQGNPSVICKSLDGGKSWTSIIASKQQAYFPSLAINPQNHANVYAGSFIGAVKSMDSGATWNPIGPPGINLKLITVDPKTPSILYAGSDSGMYKSVDGGTNWVAINNGLSAVRVEEIVSHPQSATTLYARNYKTGALKSIDGGKTWLPFGSFTGVKALAMDPQNPDIFYIHGYRVDLGRSGLFRSNDGGKIWNEIGSGAFRSLVVHILVVNPKDSNVLYAGTGKGIYQSTDGGQNWIALSNPFFNSGISHLAVNPQNPSILVAGSGKGFFKSIDSGATWNSISSETVFACIIDQKNPNTIYVGVNKGILKSVDGGVNWRMVYSIFNNPGQASTISAIAIDPQDSKIVYVGMNNGVLKSVKDGKDWKRMPNKGLGDSDIKTIAVDPTGKKIYVGTSLGVYSY
jgi:photosystem II stability/assembly factor-like uncharacterized protein